MMTSKQRFDAAQKIPHTQLSCETKVFVDDDMHGDGFLKLSQLLREPQFPERVYICESQPIVQIAMVNLGRRAIGIELKESYFNQAVKNLQNAQPTEPEQRELL